MAQHGKYSEQQKKSTIKYISEKMDRIEIKVPKGIKADLSKIAEDNGTNLTALIKNALKKHLLDLGYEIPLSMLDLKNQKDKI